jgi:choline dehydrogenase-like flavoprotein
VPGVVPPPAQRAWELSTDAAAARAGGARVPGVVDDFNSALTPIGTGRAQANVREGVRASSAHAYLTEAVRARPNLTVTPDAWVTRLVLSEREGSRAPRVTAVEFRQGRANLNGSELALNKSRTTDHVASALRKHRVQTVAVRAEVVLSAGAFASPALLMLSGIGPPKQLSALGIEVRVPLEQVGANLQDHLMLPLAWRIKDPHAFGAFPLSAGALFEWARSKSGPLATSLVHTMAFAQTGLDPSRNVADLQLQLAFLGSAPGAAYAGFLELTMNLDAPFWKETLAAEPGPVWMAFVVLVQVRRASRPHFSAPPPPRATPAPLQCAGLALPCFQLTTAGSAAASRRLAAQEPRLRLAALG